MEVLKKKRSQLKESITTIYKFVTAQEPSSFSGLKVRVEKLEITYGQFEDTQDQIELLCATEEELNTADVYRRQVDEMYFALKSAWVSLQQDNLDNTVIEGGAGNTPNTNTEISATIQALVQQQATTTSLLEAMSATLSSVTNSRSSQTQPSSSNNEIRLPALQIPDFDGNVTGWVRFRDLFRSLVDCKAGLSDVEKLEYLQTKLKGEASTIIKHLTPTNDNYQVAWDLIKRKYDKPNRIKEAYLEMLFNQSSIKNNSLSEVKRFHSNTSECYNALRVLDDSVESWDPILIFLVSKKLDHATSTLWYRQQKDDEPPSFKGLLQFLERRVSELESLSKSSQLSRFQKLGNVFRMAATTQGCLLCSQNHAIFDCQQFRGMDVMKRRAVTRCNRLCFNCLRDGNFSSECKLSSCKNCQQKHNTLLHTGTTTSQQANKLSSTTDDETTINIHSSQFRAQQSIMLPTAIIMIRDRPDSLQACRALIDSGAQSSLVTEACVQRLGLTRSYDRTLLYGIGGGSPSSTKGKVQMEVETNHKSMVVQAHCLLTLTQYIPPLTDTSHKLKFFEQLQLADIGYNKRNRIDVILGADVFGHCVLQGKIIHPSGSPTAFETIFGWVIMGSVNDQAASSTFVAHVQTNLDQQLQRFWETEECQSLTKHLSPEEEKAEKHFVDHSQRLPDGRFMVRLPFKHDTVELGESRLAALKRLESMENKFTRNPELKVEFCKFMEEYKVLHHIEIASSSSCQRYFMPHHAVLKPASKTTKLRVVFDAPCKSSNGLSLNEHLLVGPTVQNDLFTILFKFRKFAIGFTADVEKMYRQVLIHPDDRPYQSILWRTTTNEHPTIFELATVTYGTASAPFLATRTLQACTRNHKQLLCR